MFYDFAITVPADTALATPVTQDMQLTAGVVHQVEIGFPSGCAGLVHVRIGQPEATYLPTNPEGSFASDGYVIRFNEHKELSAGSNLLTAFAWNLDDTYPPTITVRIGVLPRDAVLVLALAKFITNLISILSPKRIFGGGS